MGRLGAVADDETTADGAELLSVIARVNRWATFHAELAIPPAQARLLAQIDTMGTARIGDLARADHCSQPTMTNQVQRLDEHGWVARDLDPADGRAVLISLTPQGRAVLQEVRRARAAALEPMLSRMSDVERSRLRGAAFTLAALMHAAEHTVLDDALRDT
jgi:DNA-binding MarR family transcriptional regulator